MLLCNRCTATGRALHDVDKPSVVQGHMHWTDHLLRKLSDTVKLVGPTINCEGAPYKGDPTLHYRKNPHVQSFVVATDQVGMALLLKDRNVFRCYDNIADTIYHSELGTSKVVLDAGYNIDCLMVSHPIPSFGLSVNCLLSSILTTSGPIGCLTVHTSSIIDRYS
jgi:hypothetical protein